MCILHKRVSASAATGLHLQASMLKHSMCKYVVVSCGQKHTVYIYVYIKTAVLRPPSALLLFFYMHSVVTHPWVKMLVSTGLIVSGLW